MKRQQIPVSCAHCGKSITRAPWQIASIAQHFCSRRCYGANLRAKPLAERFWSKVNKNGATPAQCPELGPCWVWTGAHLVTGYGYIHFGGKKLLAHRVSWDLNAGEDATGWNLCHRCDNPPCVNPAHLFLGTHADNVRDKCQKGRAAHRLNEHQVRAIRKALESGHVTQRSLAMKFSVSAPTIRDVLIRKTWKHVV